VRGRDLGGAVEEAIKNVGAKVQLPRGYHIDWEGEYESEKRAEARLRIIVPLTILLIFIILYTMFRSFKWALLILVNVMLARIGGCSRCWLRTPTSACPRASDSWRCSAFRCKPA
jgi:heavy metal efflux system protein